MLADSLGVNLMHTPLKGPVHWPEEQEDLEAPTSVNHTVSQHLMDEYEDEQTKLQEEARQEWKLHQEELRARAHQQWEDWALASEMGVPAKRIRLQVALISAGSSTETGRSSKAITHSVHEQTKCLHSRDHCHAYNAHADTRW